MSIGKQLHALGRFGACILAGVPSTTIIPLPLTLALTRRFRREELLKRLHLMVPWARFCLRRILRVDLDTVGREHLPASTRGHVYISNHQSYLDILLLMEVLDTVAFLSKKLVLYIPVIGQCAYAGGTIFFERKDQGSRQQALRETLKMCEESTAVVIFPEGTRSDDGDVREKIHPGAIRAAYQRRLKVIPVGLDGTGEVFPKSMDRLNLDRRVAVTIGEVIDPADFAAARPFVQAVWDRVKQLQAQSRGRRS